MYVCACRVQRKTPVSVPWTPFVYLIFWILSLTSSWVSLAWLAGWAESPRNHPASFHLPSAGVPSTCHHTWYFGVWRLELRLMLSSSTSQAELSQAPHTLCFLAFSSASASLLFPPLVGLDWMTQSEKPEPRPLLWPLAGLLTCKYFPPGLAAFHPSCDLLGLLFTCPSRKLSVLFATNRSPVTL